MSRRRNVRCVPVRKRASGNVLPFGKLETRPLTLVTDARECREGESRCLDVSSCQPVFLTTKSRFLTILTCFLTLRPLRSVPDASGSRGFGRGTAWSFRAASSPIPGEAGGEEPPALDLVSSSADHGWRSRLARWRSGAAAHGERGGEHPFAVGGALFVEAFGRGVDGGLGQCLRVLAHAGEIEVGQGRGAAVVVADDRDVARGVHAGAHERCEI